MKLSRLIVCCMKPSRTLYNRPEWKKLRADAIEHVGELCEICKRPQSKEVVLQLHHVKYIRGRLPWEYTLSELQVICKKCHAELHEKIMETSNWQVDGEIEDLEELIGRCDYCGTAIRFVHPLKHDGWGEINVGTDCADDLTESLDASKQRTLVERKKRFIKSPRWKRALTNDLQLNLKSLKVSIAQNDQKYQLKINGKAGKKIFDTEDAAKDFVFEKIDDGTLTNFFAKKPQAANM